MLSKRNSNLPLVCQVCGDSARGINFNVMSCLSCKTFFRRHSSKPNACIKPSSLKCSKENNCEINQTTRGCCSACRLNKCLTLGMDPDIIGSRRVKIDKPKSHNQLPKPCTLSLLQNDRSVLTKDEWCLLSNIVYAYDAVSVLPQMKQFFQNQSMLPYKVRSKGSIALEIHRQFFAPFLPLVQRTRLFQELPAEACEELTQNNFRFFGTFHGSFLIRELYGIDNPLFQSSFSTFYTGDIEKAAQKYLPRLEVNLSLVKIIFMILAFSSNGAIVSFDPSKPDFIFGNSISILNVENIIVTMFWKYLLYQYGYVASVQKFSSHVKFLIDMLRSVYEQETRQIREVIHTMTDNAKKSLVISD